MLSDDIIIQKPILIKMSVFLWHPPFSLLRTQSNYCRFGQCWEDHHPLPVVSVFLIECISRSTTAHRHVTFPLSF